MKISERKLRRVISNVINEMSDMLPPSLVSVGDDLIKRMADACCTMNSADIFKMCAQIFVANSGMAKHCAELCACACGGDDIGCCRCLGEICKCSHCANICKTCCNC